MNSKEPVFPYALICTVFVIGMVLGNAEARVFPKELPWLGARIALELLHVAWLAFFGAQMWFAHREYKRRTAENDALFERSRKESEEFWRVMQAERENAKHASAPIITAETLATWDAENQRWVRT